MILQIIKIMFGILILSILNNCSVDENALLSYATFPLPQALLDSELRLSENLDATLSISDINYPMQISGNTATVNITGFPEGQHAAVVTFQFTATDTVVLGTASKQVDSTKTESTLYFAEYEYEILDSDDDSFSNIMELETGSDPLNANDTPKASTEGLVAYYPFSGNANDLSSNGHNGTITGATLSTDRFGSANSAFVFNGTDSSIIVNNGPILGVMSISVWFNTFSTDYQKIIWKGQDSTDVDYSIYISSDGILKAGLHMWNAEYSYSYDEDIGSKSMISTNRWIHAVFVYDGTKFSLYLDGELQNSKPNSITGQNVTRLSGNSTPMSISGSWEESFRYCYFCFNGKIDNIRIYNRALSLNEIKVLYLNDKN